ncbi:helix-turn-helix transcriptional regulator [Citrobacter amalonaticus]|uniref:helix-turn-helix transcriptional regulator n=1 Tax=Citrobacter amalonaticus TaxID=35703 RepID=UPI00300D0444
MTDITYIPNGESSETFIVVDRCHFSRNAMIDLVNSICKNCEVFGFYSFIEFVIWRRSHTQKITSLILNVQSNDNFVVDGIIDFLVYGWKILSVPRKRILIFADRLPELFLDFIATIDVKFIINRKESIGYIRRSLQVIHHSNYNIADKWVSSLLMLPHRREQRKRRFLTNNEIRALQTIMKGDDVAKCAKELGISPKTLYCQRNSAMSKLGMSHYQDVIHYKELISILCIDSEDKRHRKVVNNYSKLME